MTTLAPKREGPAGATQARTSPYLGLRAYAEEDAAYFFGREAWTEIVSDHLVGYRLTIVYGPSGVGKSSILHAGVVDKLRRQAKHNLEASGEAEVLPAIASRWSGDPLASLADAINSSAAAIDPSLAIDPPGGSLADRFTAWGASVGGLLLVILDQFDEYFTYNDRSPDASPFADELSEAVSDRAVPANFLLSIREDALAKLDLFEDRIPDLWQNMLRVDHLDHSAAREAIERPIDRWNERDAADGEAITLEPGLVEAVLAEAEPGAVQADKAGRGRVELTQAKSEGDKRVEAPYLQLVMTRLWEEEDARSSRLLRVDTLRRLGGGDRIFRSHFDSVMQSLPRRQRAVAARVFQYLVTPAGTKIALPGSALAKWSKQKEAKVTAVLETLASGRRRILRTVSRSDDGGADASYEIFHDRLAPGILDWRRRYARRRTMKRVVLIAVPPLVIALVAAIGVISRQRAANENLREEVQRLEVEAAARDTGHLQAMLPSALASVNSVAFSGDGRRVVTTSDDGSVIVSRSRTGRPVRELRDVSFLTTRALFSRNGQLLGVETGDAWAGVWLMPNGRRHVQVPASSSFNSLAFTPDGRRIVTALDDGTAHLWDARTGDSVAVFRGAKQSLDTASLSRKGNLLVTTAGKTARLWSVSSRRQLGAFRVASGPVYAAVSPNERSLLTVSAKETVLWSIPQHRRVRLAGPLDTPIPDYEMSGLADFAADGRVALAGQANAAVFDARGRRLAPLRPPSTATIVRFSPDGQLLATGASDGDVRLWDTQTGRLRARLRAHRGSVRSLAFSPDGRFLVSGAADGTAIVWKLGILAVQARVMAKAQNARYFDAMLPSALASVNSVAFSGDGRRVVTTSDDGSVIVSRSRTGRPVRELRDVSFLTTRALFSRNGQLLGVETGDAWAGVWLMPNGRRHVQVPASSSFNSLAFTPDGRRIVTALDDGTAHLWDARTGDSVAVFRGAKQSLDTASLSRKGNLLVTTAGKTARLWSVSSRRQLGAFRVASGPVYAAVSPNERSLLTVSAKETVLWSIPQHRRVRLAGPLDTPIPDYEMSGLADFAADGRVALAGQANAAVFDARGRRLAPLRPPSTATIVRFSPDGQLLATGASDGDVRLWDTQTGRLRARLRAHRGSVRSLAFSPDGRFLVSGAADGTAIVWRVPSDA